MAAMWTRRLISADETHELGRRLGKLARPGTVVALDGELGAGKTCLAGGVGEGLDIGEPITSPTFIILAVHEGGRLPLYHMDLYRLGDASELDELGLEEALAGGGVALVEWAGRFPELLPADHLALELVIEDERTRLLRARATGPESAALLESLGG